MQRRIKEFLERVFNIETNRLLKAVVLSLREFFKDGCLQHAAALSYTTIFSLVPFLAVSFSLFHAFGAFKNLEAKFQELLFKYLIADSVSAVTDYITGFIENINAGAISAIGTAVLILTAILLLNTIEDAFNSIWSITFKRSIKDKFTNFFTIIILGPILIAVSISITTKLQRSEIFSTLLQTQLIAKFIFYMLPFLFTWLAFFLLYMIVPNTRVKFIPALIGGFMGALLWEASKLGFDLYVAKVISYYKIYGSLGIIPLFLIWIYITWVIILLGAEITYTLHHLDSLEMRPADKLQDIGSLEHMAILAIIEVGRRFSRGDGPVPRSHLASRLHLSEGAVDEVIGILEEKGFVESVDNDRGLLPCMPLDRMKMKDIVLSIKEKIDSSAYECDERLKKLFDDMNLAIKNALSDVTVKDLIEER